MLSDRTCTLLRLIRSAAYPASPQHRLLRATNRMVLSAARTPVFALIIAAGRVPPIPLTRSGIDLIALQMSTCYLAVVATRSRHGTFRA